MFKSHFRIGAATVVLMVILRMSLGCHFLYEGVWKITHPEFSAEGFLTQAKGPAAWVFHALIPDSDGRERLKIERTVSDDELLKTWRKVRRDAESRYVGPYTKRLKAYEDKRAKEEELSAEDEETVERLEAKIHRTARKFRRPSEPILWKYEDQLEAFLAKNEQAMLAFFAASAGQQESTADVDAWLAEIDRIEKEYLEALTAFAESDEDAKQAVARTLQKFKPAFDPDKEDPWSVAGNRLTSNTGRKLLRAADLIRPEKFYEPYNDLKRAAIRKYDFDEEQKSRVEKIYRHYKRAARSVLAENQADIAVYFQALERFEAKRAAGNVGAEHGKKRAHDRRQELRREVGVWLKGMEASEAGFQNALAGLLTEKQAAMGTVPVPWKIGDYIDFAVKYGLTAIGLCLLLGLFTRPAAIGGGLFMISVVMTQPAWPTIYPHDPPVVGHALLINKDFIEMLALFTVATTAVGRWAGLDYFVENYIVHFWSRLRNSATQREGEDESDS